MNSEKHSLSDAFSAAAAKDQYPIAELIKERRTVREFSPEPVADELLLELLDIANWAPNHGGREPWRYILYRGEGRTAFKDAVFRAMSAEDIKKYGEARSSYYLQIPLHLVVVMPEDPRQKQWDEDYAAACCWIQTFQLAAWERGLGVVWKTNPYMYAPAFREAAGVEPGERVVGVLHIGYPAKIPAPRPRTPAGSKLSIYGE